MYYQFTGQPGHGKTVLALDFALDMKAKADKLHAENPAKHPYRELYVCNVRDFNAGKAGAIELAPEQLKQWHLLPEFDKAIILVDEAYEHQMFPKRAPGSRVPEHVQQVAKHRHRGIDFVMICQSPSRQMDDFLHDLIEEHYHIRRRFGLPLVHVKRWDRYERNADKAMPLTTTRKKYPKHVFKLYQSTQYDTSEKRIPWFYWATAALLVGLLAMTWYTTGRLGKTFGVGQERPVASSAPDRGNGAPATVPRDGGGIERKYETAMEYAVAHLPRFGTMPWTAPIYDHRPVMSDPKLYCMSSNGGLDANGDYKGPSCRCVTEQGTRYELSQPECRTVAKFGTPYNPYMQSPVAGAFTQQNADPGASASSGVAIGGDTTQVVGSGMRPSGDTL